MTNSAKELIEKIAGAICKNRAIVNGHPHTDVCPVICPWCEVSVIDAIRAIKDAGYAIMPMEPTEEIIDAAAHKMPLVEKSRQGLKYIYKAMIKVGEQND